MRLTFIGGAGKVTGSNFLLETPNSKLLIDCGIEQGRDVAVEEMYGPFPYEPASINALVVTHAHLDHVGRIPKLVKDGFRGKIFMTPPTRDLAELILRDSAALLAEDAERRGLLPPLYEEGDIDRTLELVELLDYHVEKEAGHGLSIYLRTTGHILGSASVRVRGESGEAVAITSDLGNAPSPLLPDPEPIPDADALVLESVYGDRLHAAQQRRAEILVEALKRAIAKNGAVLIPAFSMERTQLMLYELSNFFAAGALPKVPVFLDSPLAIRVTEVYEKWGPQYFKKEAEEEMRREGSLFEFPFLKQTPSREESQKIAEVPNPKIIIAGAGMSHGGRIGRWERMYLPDPKTTLFIVGYQAPGSPGRHLAEGASRVRINGEEVMVKAHIEKLEEWSAHADRDGLLAFAAACKEANPALKQVFTALGEPASQRFLAQRIHDYLDIPSATALPGDTWEITKNSVRKI